MTVAATDTVSTRLRAGARMRAERRQYLHDQIKAMMKEKEAIDEGFRAELDEAGAKVGVAGGKIVVMLVPWTRQGYTVPDCSGESLSYP
jgi:hypothetical protein